MVSNSMLRARLSAGLLTLTGVVAGCAHTAPPPDAPIAAPATEVSAAPPPEMTATEAAIAAAGNTAPAVAVPVPASEVQPTAPMHYTCLLYTSDAADE